MKAFLATVLSVIAAAVLLIAYGLLAPHASAVSTGVPVFYDPQTGMYQPARPVFANERIALPDSVPAYGYQGMPVQYGAPVGYQPAVYTTSADYSVAQAPAVRTSQAVLAAPRRTAATRVVDGRTRGRDWKKTALVIGGSTATAAGVGAIFGGRKGALIGAAIGGGASTLYEAKH